jgi:hypothetical protein
MVFNLNFEVEHVVPVSRDGSDDESNLACRACNLYKTNHLTAVDETSQTEVPLFQPRRDNWKEHFAVDPETCVIRGLTAVGRATVARLRMNSSLQIEARKQWLKLGLFP